MIMSLITDKSEKINNIFKSVPNINIYRFEGFFFCNNISKKFWVYETVIINSWSVFQSSYKPEQEWCKTMNQLKLYTENREGNWAALVS
jgi:hypothetical protein